MQRILIIASALSILTACNASSSDASVAEPRITDSDLDIVSSWAATQTDSHANDKPHSQSSSLPPVSDMIEGLERRLVDAPDDLKGWSLLATSYAFVGQMSDAKRAKLKAIELGADGEQLEQQILDAHTGAQR